MSKKLVVVAGGTGGHIFPGIAVADYLKEQGWQVSWIGTPDRMEADVVPKHNIEIDFINALHFIFLLRNFAKSEVLVINFINYLMVTKMINFSINFLSLLMSFSKN